MPTLIQLPEVLAAAARGRGVASVAVIQRTGAAAHASWVPESEQEPAFLAYSITKTFTAALILTLCEAWGLVVGHNGGGPCYSASAIHAFDLSGASVCAMGAIEEGFSAEDVVFDVLDQLAAPPTSTVSTSQNG